MSKYENIHIEKDFWDDFIVEAFEHIDEIETNAMSLDQNPDDMEVIHTMFRAFHTIKGLSGFVEHSAIQEIAHKTETLMDYCRKGELKVNTKIVDAILKSSDYIKQLCNDVDAFLDETLVNNIENLLVVLENLANVEDSTAEVSAEVAEPQTAPEVEAQIETTETTEPETTTEPEALSDEQKLEDFANEFTFEEEAVSSQEPIQEEVIEEEEEVAKEATSENFENVEQIVEQVADLFEEEAKQSETLVYETAANVAITEAAQTDETAKTEVITVASTPESAALKSFQKDIMKKLKGETQSRATEQNKENSPIKSAGANEEYMKVANHKIDHLVDMIGELIINQSLIEQYVASTYSEDKELVTNMSGFLRITRELQSLSMSLRMVSLKPTFQKVARIARDTIQELGKNVEIIMTGEGTEIDRVVTDKLLDPLVHLIKNAISHGVEEKSEDRISQNKNPRARVELNAYSKRGKIFIEIKDDGRGINTEIVYQKALEKGLVDPNRTYSDAEIKEFILLPGFSTAKVVDNISGRGVGMDVVKTQILKIGGKVDIQSKLNEGSTFTLEVPVNHAIMNGTIIEVNKQHFVVPTINVKEFLQPHDEQWIFTQQKRTMIKVRDNIIPIIPLSTFFKDAKEEEHTPLVMILELDQELKALPITNVINRQEVVVKPLGEEFLSLKYISGMSILGTGKVSLILDIDYLFKKEVKE